jgi:SAM-dependent methyltransferase
MTSHQLPLRAGTVEDRATLQGLVSRAGLFEPDVAKRLGIPSTAVLELADGFQLLQRFEGDDLQAALIRLFIVGHQVPRRLLEELCSAGERAVLERTGLIAPATGSEDVIAPIRLVPVTACGVDLIVACDRMATPEGTPAEPRPDVIFSGHNPLTRQFLQLLPGAAQGDLLELCSGTAVAAMALASSARRVVAVDIAARSTEVAAFNVWLNARCVDVRQGDAYEPVAGESFDRIIAHPPYVPTRDVKTLFRDGGELGESITRRVITGAPAHLRVGGTLHLLCIGMDTADGLFEQRARHWMGVDGESFDVLYAIENQWPPEEFATRTVKRMKNPAPDELERELAILAKHGVKEVSYGALVARRLQPGERGEERRVRLESKATSAGFEWWLRWTDIMRQPGFQTALSSSTPRMADGTTVDVNFKVVDGKFAAQHYRLSNCGKPFPATLETDGWVVALLSELDGSTSLTDLIDRAHRNQIIPDPFSIEDAQSLFTRLLERGMVRSDLVPFPSIAAES